MAAKVDREVLKVFKSKHASEILKQLNRERKNEKKYCDITIQVSGHDFSVHKCVLGTFSDFYGKMFTTEMKEKYETKAKIENVSLKIMEKILDFVYTAEIEVTFDDVYDLLAAADYMQVPHIKDFCSAFLMRFLDFTNCLSARVYAKRYNCDKLGAKAKKVLKKNFEAVLEREEFMQMAFPDLKDVLQLKRKAALEDKVFLTVLDWIKQDEKERQEYFPNLFDFILLQNLSKPVIEKALSEEMLLKYPDCYELLVRCAEDDLPDYYHRIEPDSSSSDSSSDEEDCSAKKCPTGEKQLLDEDKPVDGIVVLGHDMADDEPEDNNAGFLGHFKQVVSNVSVEDVTGVLQSGMRMWDWWSSRNDPSSSTSAPPEFLRSPHGGSRRGGRGRHHRGRRRHHHHHQHFHGGPRWGGPPPRGPPPP
ncbi:kelch-like protein 12 isoform X1 [Clavelina lepadiformis]|uniref:kelch-like protein 12 isoform X1 n=2 Tax=Clavelina lepadiformis TaxID=159417 RepID=UPI004041015F